MKPSRRDPYDDYYEKPRRDRRREYDDYEHGPPPRDSRRDYYDDRAPRRERPRAPERKSSKWQKEAKDLFMTYALPVIKTEGGKFLSKQVGGMLAKQGAGR